MHERRGEYNIAKRNCNTYLSYLEHESRNDENMCSSGEHSFFVHLFWRG